MYFATGCKEFLTKDLYSEGDINNRNLKYCDRTLCISKSCLKPLVLFITDNEVQVWSDIYNNHVLLAKLTLPRDGINNRDVSPSCHAVWHPFEANLFAVLYRGQNLAVFSLGDKNTGAKGAHIKGLMYSVKCLHYSNFWKRDTFRSGTSILAVKNHIFITGNNKRIARLSWTCAVEEIFESSKNIVFFTFESSLSCVGMVMATGEAGISFFRDTPDRDTFSCDMKNSRFSLLYAGEVQHKNNPATLVSISGKCFRVAIGLCNGDLYIYCLKEKLGSLPNNSPSQKSFTAVSVTLYSKISLQGMIEHSGFLVGSVSAIKWTSDSGVLAAGYSMGGIAVWTSSGDCLFSTLSCVNDISNSMNLTPQIDSQQPEIQNVVSLSWLSSSFLLLAAFSHLQNNNSLVDPKGKKWQIVQVNFLKSIDTSCMAVSKLQLPVLIGPTFIYRYHHHRRRRKWQKLCPLKDYIETNAPLNHCSISPSAMYVAIAGKTGFILFEDATVSWRIFPDLKYTKNFQCLELAWLDDNILVCLHVNTITIWNVAKSNNRKQILTIPLTLEKYSAYGIVPTIGDANKLCLAARRNDSITTLSFFYVSFSYSCNNDSEILNYNIGNIRSPIIDGHPVLRICCLAENTYMQEFAMEGTVRQETPNPPGVLLLLRNNGSASLIGLHNFKKHFELGQRVLVYIWYSEFCIRSNTHLPSIKFWFYERKNGLHLLLPNDEVISVRHSTNCYLKNLPLGIIPYNGRFLYCMPALWTMRSFKRTHQVIKQRSFSYLIILLIIHLPRAGDKMAKKFISIHIRCIYLWKPLADFGGKCI
jgi:hypothetical protein